MPDFNSVLYGIIGKRICDLRKLNNENQEELAEKIGINRSSISNIELGRQQISLHLIFRIAQVYNTDVYSLLPNVNEVAGRVSIALDNISEVLKQQQVGAITKKRILELLK